MTDVVSGSNGETIAASTKILTVTKTNTAMCWQVSTNSLQCNLDPILNVSLDHEWLSFSAWLQWYFFVVARAFAPGGDQFKMAIHSSLSIKA